MTSEVGHIRSRFIPREDRVHPISSKRLLRRPTRVELGLLGISPTKYRHQLTRRRTVLRRPGGASLAKPAWRTMRQPCRCRLFAPAFAEPLDRVGIAVLGDQEGQMSGWRRGGRRRMTPTPSHMRAAGSSTVERALKTLADLVALRTEAAAFPQC